LSVVANANRLRRFTPRPLAATTRVADVDPLVEVGGSVEASHHTQRKETTMFSLFGKKKDTTTAKVVDPVCGMKINPADAAATRDHDGTTIHFCSTHCAAAFDTDPHRYAHGPSGAGHH